LILVLGLPWGLSLKAQSDKQEPVYVEPPEEDESLITPKVYTFNPLQAKKEISTGDFYMKRGNFRGAAARFHEATMWDDGSEEAFFKWGEAAEKMKDYTSAREAFGKYVAMTSDKKKADEVRKRVAKMPKVDKVAPAEAAPLRIPQGYPIPGQNPASSQSKAQKR
jgi:tetratricopeptide (TPR) repeat protein